MIIHLVAKNWPDILDEVVTNYEASLPVRGEDDLIVGSVWIASHTPKLVVLDVVQDGALKLYNDRGDHVIYTNGIPFVPMEMNDEILCVCDEHSEIPIHCELAFDDDDQLVAYIEEALGL